MQYGQLPKQILSRHGFEGCLASLDLSGESTNLINDAVVPSTLVESGCDMYASLHSGKKCTHDLCANHGTCVQQWNSYTCDCDMTSFTGSTCNDGKDEYSTIHNSYFLTPVTAVPRTERNLILSVNETGAKTLNKMLDRTLSV